MRQIAQMTRQIVERAKNYQADTVPGDYATLKTACPKCGGQIQENYRRYACTACDFSISKIPGARQLEVTEAEQLIAQRHLGPLQGFRSKMGRPFAAILKLTDDHRLEFDFGQSARDDEADAQAVDFSDQTSLGACPKCGSRVFSHGMNYVCEYSVGADRRCDFRTGKVILQQEVSQDQLKKLLADGATDLLTDFVSSRTRRKFKAKLVRGPDGRIGFEFAPRPAAKAKAKPEAPERAEVAAKPAAKPASTASPAKAKASRSTARDPGAAKARKTPRGKAG
jgi:DNA topoisomerase-3